MSVDSVIKVFGLVIEIRLLWRRQASAWSRTQMAMHRHTNHQAVGYPNKMMD
jgi:hypothetical protein